jgi:outer membrane receptor protein involved in Fe transport
MKNTQLQLTALFFSTFFSAGVTADESDNPSQDIFSLTLQELMQIKVQSASRTEEQITNAPATIRVISRKQIQDRGYRNIADAIQGLIGFDHAWASDAPNFNRVSVRGIFGNNKLIILQDGIRISPPTGELIAIAENFPLYLVEQIEVLLGPASALYGADAMSAVINLITVNRNSTSNNLHIQTGQTDFGQINALINWQNDEWYLRLGAHKQQQSLNKIVEHYPQEFTLRDLNNFSGDTIIPAQSRLGPNFDNTSDSFDLQLKYLDSWTVGHTQRTFRHSTGIASSPDFVDYGKQPEWDTLLSTTYLKYHTQISNTWETEIQITDNLYELSPDTSFANIFVNYDRGYKYAKGMKRDWLQLFKGKLAVDQKLTFGYVYEDLESIPLTADLPIPYRPNLSNVEQALFFPNTNNELAIPLFNINWHNYSYFVQLQSQLTENLTTTLGLRYDKSSTYGSTYVPRVGLVYKPSDDNTLKLSYGEAFLAPSPQNSYRFFGAFAFQRNDNLYQSFFFQIPNTRLEPEKLKTLELGWTQFLSDSWLVESNLFINKLEDLIQTVITDEPVSDFISGANIATTQINDNVGKLKSFGADLTVTYQSDVGESGALQSWLNYSYVDGHRESHGQSSKLPFTTKHKLRIGLTLKTNNWTFSPVLRWQDRSTLSEVGVALDKYANQFTVADLFIEKKDVFDSFDIHLDIKNLSDEKYGVPGEGNTSVFVEVPQLRRWILIGFRYRF